MDLTPVQDAYAKQFAIEGDTPQGLFSKSQEATNLRFNQLLRILQKGPRPASMSVLDYGCGTGDLILRLKNHGLGRYLGVELVGSIRSAAKAKYPECFFLETLPEMDEHYDFSFVSGTFNFRTPAIPEVEWREFVRAEIARLWKATRYGMALNFMIPNPDWKDENLWYPTSQYEPIALVPTVDIKELEVVEGYGLYEFTLLITRKTR